MSRLLFVQGLDLVIEALQKLQGRDDVRATANLIERIAELRGTGDTDAVVAPKNEESVFHDSPPAHKKSNVEPLSELRSVASVCTKCPHLAASRHTVVFGVGNPNADLMFVGEAPGADEDLKGEPFVGRAGELLTKIIHTMGFERPEVYIANVLKCRPDIPAGAPGNRQPTEQEMANCLPYLRQQIELIQPKVMVALGGVAMRGLFGKNEPMKNLRGRWHSFGSVPVMATFHPSYLLRNQALSEKRKVWEDMLLVLERLGRHITERQRNYFLKG